MLKKLVTGMIPIIIISGLILKHNYSDKEVINIQNDTKYVYPVGEVVNIKAETCGVLVIGYEDEDVEYVNGIKIGDTILEIDGTEINDVSQIPEILSKEKEEVKILLERKGEKIEETLVLKKYDGEYKLGVWVRNKISGVGTLTYYNPEDDEFGAIAHPIVDSDTNEILKLKKGEIYKPDNFNITKSDKNHIGEIESEGTNQQKIGCFSNNDEFGIKGNVSINKDNRQLVQVGNTEDIKIGEAYIIFENSERNMETYEINIDQVDYENKQMSIKVTDEKLIEYTGGIVRGMSGSPICQDGKLIGAIGYVDASDSTVGYGVFIEEMLN